MTLKRFYVDSLSLNGDIVEIYNEEFNHITKVLRYKVGYKIIVCINDGRERYCEITEIAKDKVVARVEETVDVAVRPYGITLYAALLNNNKLDFTIQKCTELGMDKIVPVIFENCDEKKFNLERAERIAKEAAKQCKAVTIPTVENLISYEDFLKRLSKHENVIFAYENNRDRKIKEISLGNDIAIVVGPEGGFTKLEAEQIREFSNVVTLGNRILRAETAAVVATTLVLNNKGEL